MRQISYTFTNRISLVFAVWLLNQELSNSVPGKGGKFFITNSEDVHFYKDFLQFIHQGDYGDLY